jgi:hypothetical protein
MVIFFNLIFQIILIILEIQLDVSLDCAWSHRKNALECVLDIIDINTNKIIYFLIARKPRNNDC